MALEIFGIRDDCWKTASEITGGDGHNGARDLRANVEAFNNNYGKNGQREYILSGSKGYRLTTDSELIGEAIKHDKVVTGLKWRRINKREKNWKKMVKNYDNEIRQISLPI